MLISSCKDDSDDTQNKIQKNSTFQPVCDGLESRFVTCPEGAPACGTEPGSGEIKVHCINRDDVIVPLAKNTCGDGDSLKNRPTCKPI